MSDSSEHTAGRSDKPTYVPKDALRESMVGGAVGFVAGTTLAATKTALTKENVGPKAVVLRYGSSISTFTAVAGMYGFSSRAVANLRQKDDALNEAIGGFIGGSMAGLIRGSMKTTLGVGAATGVALGTMGLGGGWFSNEKNADAIDGDEKEAIRKNRRRPVEETIAALGEGRGIYGPNYQERRRQLLKEKYDIDVQPTITNRLK